MEENSTIENMLHTLFEIQMSLFYEQCDLIFEPMEDIVKGEELMEEISEAPNAYVMSI